MNKHNLNKGFTLIELLVVIAIIGILSSVVLASLNSARDNATEAGILSSLKNISTQAEIYRANEGTYAGLCEDPKIKEMESALDTAECYTVGSTHEIAKIDYGVIASANDTYYGADPRGVYTFDDADTSASAQWGDGAGEAVKLCSDLGKKLPGPSTLRAKDNLDGTAGGFSASGYWSYLESPSDSSRAYDMDFDLGNIYRPIKIFSLSVRCVH